MKYQYGIFRVSEDEFLSSFAQILRECHRVKFIDIDGAKISGLEEYWALMRKELDNFDAAFEFLEQEHQDDDDELVGIKRRGDGDIEWQCGTALNCFLPLVMTRVLLG